MIVLKSGRTPIEAIAIGPAGRPVVAPGFERGLLVWDDPTAGGEVRAIPATEQEGRVFGPVHLSADGRWASGQGMVTPLVFETSRGEVVSITRTQRPPADDPHAPIVATVAPHGIGVIVCEPISAPRRLGGHSTQVSLRTLPGAKLNEALWTVTTANLTHNAPVVNGDEVVIAANARNQLQNRWGLRLVALDLATGNPLRTSVFVEHRGPLHKPVVSPEKKFVVYLHGKAFVIWPAGAWDRPPRLVANDTKQHFTGIAFHPSGKYLVATSNDATVKLYDTATWQVARTFTWQIGRMRSIAFSPDGTLAAAGSDSGKVVVWDVDL